MENSRLLKFFKLDKLVEGLTGYFETRLELAKIEIREEASHIFSKLIRSGIIFILASIVGLFISVAGALFIGEALHNLGWGFLIVAGFYLLLLLLIGIFGNTLGLYEKIDKYLTEMFKKDDSDE